MICIGRLRKVCKKWPEVGHRHSDGEFSMGNRNSKLEVLFSLGASLAHFACQLTHYLTESIPTPASTSLLCTVIGACATVFLFAAMLSKFIPLHIISFVQFKDPNIHHKSISESKAPESMVSLWAQQQLDWPHSYMRQVHWLCSLLKWLCCVAN